MPAKPRRKLAGCPRLTPRDQDLIRRFLLDHRATMLAAYMTARASRELAPGLSQYAAMMSHRKNQMSGVDYMLAHLNDRLQWLAELPDYVLPAGE